jgi:hypothetical protein
MLPAVRQEIPVPYLRCPRCGLLTFTAAHWSSVDHCDRCHVELPRPAARPSGHERVDAEDAVRERLYGRPRSGASRA